MVVISDVSASSKMVELGYAESYSKVTAKKEEKKVEEKKTDVPENKKFKGKKEKK